MTNETNEKFARTPVGNAAAMREALTRFVGWYNATSIRSASLNTIANLANAALSASPRYCDVGTVEEQFVRCMATFRASRKCFTSNEKLVKATMAWAQMPYEAQEGGAK